jgi:hypothetical protein
VKLDVEHVERLPFRVVAVDVVDVAVVGTVERWEVRSFPKDSGKVIVVDLGLLTHSCRSLELQKTKDGNKDAVMLLSLLGRIASVFAVESIHTFIEERKRESNFTKLSLPEIRFSGSITNNFLINSKPVGSISGKTLSQPPPGSVSEVAPLQIGKVDLKSGI